MHVSIDRNSTVVRVTPTSGDDRFGIIVSQSRVARGYVMQLLTISNGLLTVVPVMVNAPQGCVTLTARRGLSGLCMLFVDRGARVNMWPAFVVLTDPEEQLTLARYFMAKDPLSTAYCVGYLMPEVIEELAWVEDVHTAVAAACIAFVKDPQSLFTHIRTMVHSSRWPETVSSRSMAVATTAIAYVAVVKAGMTFDDKLAAQYFVQSNLLSQIRTTSNFVGADDVWWDMLTGVVERMVWT